ncbi:MAG: SH3 domain-containing protein [Anaerolineales bacterium]|nr:SH3 domain-containing protein [Anaerolineales bacterium]
MYLKGIQATLFLALALVLAACNLPTSVNANPTTTEPPTSMASDTPAPSATPSSTLPEPPAATATATAPAEVIITANSGNLNIRRGPGLYYNVVTSMVQGENATASGRDDQGTWLYVAIPANPAAFGWVSTQTQYSTISGDIFSLPIVAAAPPLPAYIRNCTFHPMLVNPGGILLEPQTGAPANTAQFAPGVFTAADQSVAGSTPHTISLAEGNTVDITKDGLDNVYACP